MADINPITPVAAGIQPPQQMSLGDMMNIARGSQAYQQAAQINPYLAQIFLNCGVWPPAHCFDLLFCFQSI